MPVVHHLAFGCEVRVEAKNLKEAKKLALKSDAEMESGDSYDWDRQTFTRATLGKWQKIEVQK